MDLTEAESNRLTCLTYNVFSGPSSSSIPHLSLRTRSAIALLRRVATSADRERATVQVMALQEVSSTFERALLRERWLQADWAITSLRDYFRSSTGGKSERASARGEDDGVLLAVRRDVLQEGAGGGSATMMRLSGPQGKVLVSLSLANRMRIATSHFESLAPNEAIRTSQYRETASHLLDISDEPPPCICIGDFNHASYSELAPLVGCAGPGLFKDVGTSSEPFRANATFGELYPFFDGSRERRKPRRIDLVLVGPGLEATDTWTDGGDAIQTEKSRRPKPDEAGGKKRRERPKKTKLRCKEGKGGYCYPSDHLAVLATVGLTYQRRVNVA